MVPVGAPRKSRRSSAAEPRSERGAVTIPAHSVGSLRGCQGVALDSRSAPPSIGGAVLDRDDRLGPTSIS